MKKFSIVLGLLVLCILLYLAGYKNLTGPEEETARLHGRNESKVFARDILA